jgi:histidinol-phosphatase (PHP family)
MGELEDYVKEAISQGFSALGFSCHTPGKLQDVWHMKNEDFPYYIEEINRLKILYGKEIELYIGLELDYLEDTEELVGNEFLEHLDFTIASLHMMRHAKSDQYLTIDGPMDEFKTLLKDNFGGDIKKFAAHYFTLQERMIESYSFDILGHCDLIKKRNSHHQFFDPEAPWYQEMTLNFLERIAPKGVRLEISTGGIARNSIEETYPSPEMVKRCAELKIPLTLNSDAHYYPHIAHFFPEALQLLKEVGYQEVDVLTQGEWLATPIV